jgi:hypothetical protein
MVDSEAGFEVWLHEDVRPFHIAGRELWERQRGN